MPSKETKARLSRTALERLIKGYNRVVQEPDRNRGMVPKNLRDGLKVFRRWAAEYKKGIEKRRMAQSSDANRFNLLEVMQMTQDENCHSNILAWLLDHRGTHAQGYHGFLLFLDEFGLKKTYADTDYWVRREVSGDKSRIDIEVAARKRFIIHIENKITAEETVIGSEKQTKREWEDLLRRGRSLGVPRAHIHAFFLSPDADEPDDKHFKAISWNQITTVLERFSRQQCVDRNVRLFAEHYVEGLRRFVTTSNEEEESDNDTDMV